MMNIINEKTGKILQNKVFESYSGEGKNWFQCSDDDVTLNDFLRETASEDVYKILPMGTKYGKILVFYYTTLECENEEK